MSKSASYLAPKFFGLCKPKVYLIAFLSLVVTLMSCEQEQDEPEKPNVFLIYVDDLRPELGAYGNKMIQSPHMDQLANDAMVFNRAYANIPVCGASRASMLTGVMPNRNRFVGYMGNAEKEVPNAITIPAYLKQNGYKTLSLGKVFHTVTDSKFAWSEPPYRGPKQSNKDYALQENIDIDNDSPRNRAGFFEIADTVDEAYLDGKMALKAIEKLDSHDGQDSSLFMAVGFWKPHLPFNAPTQYWDLYDPASLPYPSNYFLPENAPAGSIHNFGELRSYTNVPNDSIPLDSALVRRLIHGYYASISYVDQQIGKFIQGLKDKNLYDDSVIILVGDHGWFLGEHTLWCKHAVYEKALRSAFMIKFPGNERKGATDLPIGLAELYPTLMEVIGLDKPAHIDNESFLAMLDMPETAYEEKSVYCRYEDGETILKGKYAYTEYYNDAGEQYTRMLYDHETDPDENRNIVDEVDPKTLSALENDLAAYITKYQ